MENRVSRGTIILILKYMFLLILGGKNKRTARFAVTNGENYARVVAGTHKLRTPDALSDVPPFLTFNGRPFTTGGTNVVGHYCGISTRSWQRRGGDFSRLTPSRNWVFRGAASKRRDTRAVEASLKIQNLPLDNVALFGLVYSLPGNCILTCTCSLAEALVFLLFEVAEAE